MQMTDRGLLALMRHEGIVPGPYLDVKNVWTYGVGHTAAAGPPAAADSIFLATHEPCCMCISSIVWSGFKRCYYLFPYETTRDQGIPHDLNIMYELWRVPRYAQRNAFCATAGLLPLIAALEDGGDRAELEATVARITQRYDELSTKYHAEKAANPLNTMAFN